MSPQFSSLEVSGLESGTEAAVWTPPRAQKATSTGDGAESHGRCWWWGDSSLADAPTDALAAALVLGEQSGV